MLPHITLLVVALWTAWRPAETVAATPVVLAAAALLLLPWAHRRTDQSQLKTGLAALAAGLVAAGLSSAGGWDRSTAVSELALVFAVVTLVWIGSRSTVSRGTHRMLALGIGGLAGWGLWQLTVGFDRARASVAELPVDLQANALERLDSGRAFASLLLPGHLAILLAAALPILVAGIRLDRRSVPWAVGAALCVAGLLMTRSPIGIGLAGLGLAALVIRRRSSVVTTVVVILLAVLVVSVIWRPDVGQLDPVRLRVDNWRTALWVWAQAPFAGAGLGSFGQAARAVPFAVGNRPAHAHGLPLELAAELGVAGLALFALVSWWLATLMIRLWPRRPELAVSVAVVYLHNLLDFSLYTSGVAIPWAVLLGWSLAETREPAEVKAQGPGRTVLVAMAALAVAGTLLHATSIILEGAAAVPSEPAHQRYDDAAAAFRIAPWRADPLPVAAAAALDSGDRSIQEEASRLISSGRHLRPASASLAEAAGRLDLALGRVPAGAAEILTAARVQPASPKRREAWEALRSRLDEGRVNASR